MQIDAPRISREHWAWVRGLIRDIEREEQRDEFLKQLFQWDLAVREFRKVEMSLMIMGQPDENDFHCHAICLHSLLALGHSLAMLSAEFNPAELAHCRVEHPDIDAYVEELEQSYREWHNGFSVEEIKAAEVKIFGGAA
jgi:hypothetical protein